MIRNLNQTLVELLFQFDCVIIPDFGAFIKREKAAFFSKDTQSFHPASVELIFNEQLKEDDALLSKYIQLKDTISSTEAKNLIRTYVDELRITLYNEGVVHFDGLGKMTLNIYDQIIFNSHPAVPLLQKQFGFQSLSLEPILKQESEKTSGKGFRKRWVAAAIIAVPILMVSVWAIQHPEKVKDTYYHYASLIPVQSESNELSYTANFEVPFVDSFQMEKEALIEKLLAKIPVDSAAMDSTSIEESAVMTSPKESIITVPKTEATVIKKTAKATPKTIIDKGDNTEKDLIEQPFHIIVGAFSSKKNANKKIRQLTKKGYEGLIVHQENSKLHRVSVQRFPSEAEAEAELVKFKSEFQGAWVLHQH